MNEQVKDYIDKYPNEIIDMYNKLRKIVFLAYLRKNVGKDTVLVYM